MKLLHILGTFKLPRTPGDGVAGTVRAALELARVQARGGHDVTLTSVGSDRVETLWEGVRLLQLPGTPWARVRLGGHTFDLSTHTPFIRLTQRESFDVVQGHLYYYLRFLRARARLAHFHADPFYGLEGDRALAAKRADFRVIAGCSDVQVAVSDYIARRVREGLTLAGAPLTTVRTVPNGVLFEPFAAAQGAARRSALGLPPEAVVFLYVGAVVPEKGLRHLVEAFIRVAGHDERAHLLVAGGASLWDMAGQSAARGYEAAVAERAQGLLAAGRVHLLGPVPSSAMPELYAAADVAVIPSVWPEPFGLVALEAFASGKPVIATSTGGLPETVGEANGRLVPPGDEAALAAAMLAFTDPGVRRSRGTAGQAHARSRSWEAAAGALETIYEQILAVKS